MPISELVLYRTRGVAPTAVPAVKDTKASKFTGLKLESAGAVGESLLHLCMLNGTDIHIKVRTVYSYKSISLGSASKLCRLREAVSIRKQ